MAKETVRSELYGIRVTPLDKARIEFLAKVAEKSPTSIAAMLLAEAARQKIHEMSAPPVAGVTSPTSESDNTGPENARSI